MNWKFPLSATLIRKLLNQFVSNFRELYFSSAFVLPHSLFPSYILLAPGGGADHRERTMSRLGCRLHILTNQLLHHWLLAIHRPFVCHYSSLEWVSLWKKCRRRRRSWFYQQSNFLICWPSLRLSSEEDVSSHQENCKVADWVSQI